MRMRIMRMLMCRTMPLLNIRMLDKLGLGNDYASRRWFRVGAGSPTRRGAMAHGGTCQVPSALLACAFAFLRNVRCVIEQYRSLYEWYV